MSFSDVIMNIDKTKYITNSLSNVDVEDFLRTFDEHITKKFETRSLSIFERSEHHINDYTSNMLKNSKQSLIDLFPQLLKFRYDVDVLLLKQQAMINISLVNLNDNNMLSCFDEVVKHGFMLRNLNTCNTNNLYGLMVGLYSRGVKVNIESRLLNDFWKSYTTHFNVISEYYPYEIRGELHNEVYKLLNELKNKHTKLTPSDLLSCNIHNFILKYYLFRLFYYYVTCTVHADKGYNTSYNGEFIKDHRLDDLHVATFERMFDELFDIKLHIDDNVFHDYESFKQHCLDSSSQSKFFVGILRPIKWEWVKHNEETILPNHVAYLCNIPDVGVMLCDDGFIELSSIDNDNEDNDSDEYDKCIMSEVISIDNIDTMLETSTYYHDNIVYSNVFMSTVIIDPYSIGNVLCNDDYDHRLYQTLNDDMGIWRYDVKPKKGGMITSWLHYLLIILLMMLVITNIVLIILKYHNRTYCDSLYDE